MVTESNAVDQAVRVTSPITVQRSLTLCVTLRVADAGSFTVALPLVLTNWPGWVCPRMVAVRPLSFGIRKVASPPVILCVTLER
ncbi:hypothetical protein G6F59_017600 [Rhizopus arrhizus]|nr:hypothetical protein G6F59_017600 [Rhizopus arrhizus]